MIIKSRHFSRESVLDSPFPTPSRDQTSKPHKIRTTRLHDQYKHLHRKQYSSSLDHIQETQEVAKSFSNSFRITKKNKSQNKQIKKQTDSFFQFVTPKHSTIKQQHNSKGFRSYKTKSISLKKHNEIVDINRYPVQQKTRSSIYERLLRGDEGKYRKNANSIQAFQNQYWTQIYDAQQKCSSKSYKRRPLLFNVFKNKIQMINKNLTNFQ